MEGATRPYAYALSGMSLTMTAIANSALPFASGACLPTLRSCRSGRRDRWWRTDYPFRFANRYSAGDNRIDVIPGNAARSPPWRATRNEWLGLLDAGGLEPEALYRGFARELFTDDSREYVLVARRPAPAARPDTDNAARPRHSLALARAAKTFSIPRCSLKNPVRNVPDGATHAPGPPLPSDHLS